MACFNTAEIQTCHPEDWQTAHVWEVLCCRATEGQCPLRLERRAQAPPQQHPQLHQGAAAGNRHPVAMAHAGQVNVPAQLRLLGEAHCREFLVCRYRPAPAVGSSSDTPGVGGLDVLLAGHI